jgi:hypothetical protein
MSPRRPRRRRARRRSPTRPVVLLVGAVVVLALVIGGLTQVSRQSQGYDANSARALAAQGAVVADQSNQTSTQVRTVFDNLQDQSRQALQVTLDTAVQQTAAESAHATLAARSSPLGPVAANFAAVFADRARSMTQLRAAMDGFLGMGPIPDAGSPATTTPSGTGSGALLSATEATNRIAAAGALLSRADSLYRSVRHSLARGDGHGRLPGSVWVTDPQIWQVGTLAAQVDLMATSASLATSHDVVIRTVRLDPPALPSPQGAPANISVLSPSRHVSVTVVLANQGSVDEVRVPVRESMADQTSGTTATHVERASLALDGSVTLSPAVFSIKPGTAYLLTVQIVVPSGQTSTNGTLYEQALQVAPST